jgi:putative FmdB family regulatory protein
MTTRNYKCTRCHHDWEAHQSPHDENLVFCPWCDKPTSEAVKETEEEG